MQLFYPMAGAGQRLKAAGYQEPKPLIRVGGTHLIQLALDSTAGLGTRLHYILHKELACDERLASLLPVGCWHVLLLSTPGPLQTCLQATGCLKTEDDILICDCDSLINREELARALDLMRHSQAVGGITVRKTHDADCSYVRLTPEWWVEDAREKEVISDWSSTGPYWFRSGFLFLEAAKRAAAAHQTTIAPVYPYLSGRTKAVPVESFLHLGTPEALAKWQQTSLPL